MKNKILLVLAGLVAGCGGSLEAKIDDLNLRTQMVGEKIFGSSYDLRVGEKIYRNQNNPLKALSLYNEGIRKIERKIAKHNCLITQKPGCKKLFSNLIKGRYLRAIAYVALGNNDGAMKELNWLDEVGLLKGSKIWEKEEFSKLQSDSRFRALREKYVPHKEDAEPTHLFPDF